MAKAVYRVADVTPELDNWTAKVVVYFKGDLRQAANKNKRYQHITFMDSEGTKINATLFDYAITHFQKTLIPFETYFISNARVNPSTSNLGPSFVPYQWVINTHTVINKVNADIIPRPAAVPEYVLLSELCSLPDRSLVDIVGVVIANFGECVVERVVDGEKQENTVAEFGVLDLSNTCIILTMWNNYATIEGRQLSNVLSSSPIIAAQRLTKSSYYGTSMGTTAMSVIEINPKSSEADSLRTWLSAHKNEISGRVQELVVVYHQPRHAVDEVVREVTIAEAMVTTQREKFSVRVVVEIMDHQQKFFYIGCSNCSSFGNLSAKVATN